MRFGCILGEDSISLSHLHLQMDGQEPQHWVKAVTCSKATRNLNEPLFHRTLEIEKDSLKRAKEVLCRFFFPFVHRRPPFPNLTTHGGILRSV